MPNYCSYYMKVKGEKESCFKVLEILQRNYNVTSEDEPHLWRVFDAGLCEEEEDFITIYGNCAWSVYSCMFDGPHTYQSTDTTGKGTTITEISKELKVDIEITSEEPGLEFSEHYVIKHGNLVLEEEDKFQEFYVGEYTSLEEANKDLGSNITQEEWDNSEDGYIQRGGMDTYEFII